MATVLLDVSVLGSSSRVRGIGRYVADLARGLAAIGKEQQRVELLALETLPWLGRPNIRGDLLGSVDRLTSLPLERLMSHASWAYRKRLVAPRALYSVRPTLLHSPHPDATPFGPTPGLRLVTCHDLIPLRFPDRYTSAKDGFGPGRWLLDYRRYHSADHILAISHATASDLVALLGIDSSKISVVYNGVDLNKWNPAVSPSDGRVLARLGLQEGAYVLFVGDGDWRKNVEGALAAVARVRKRPGTKHLQLVWAGKLSSERQQRAKALAESFGDPRVLKLLGYVSDQDLAALYRHAVCQLFVSRAEGFGYPAIEAMACGCPVIASDRSSVGEVTAGAAVTVEPENHAQITDALYQVARQSSSARQAMVQAGLRRARQFTFEKMARETMALYERLCGS